MLETKNEEEFSLIREVAVLLTSSIYRQVLLNALSYMREKRQTKIEEEASGSFLLRPSVRCYVTSVSKLWLVSAKHISVPLNAPVDGSRGYDRPVGRTAAGKKKGVQVRVCLS